MENDYQEKDRNANGLQLKLILIISNVFSGLISTISMILAKSINLFPSYITNIEYIVAVLLAFIVFITSIGVWLGKKRFYLLFVFSMTMNYLSYIHNRFVAFIYGTISLDIAVTKIAFASLWILIIWGYFYFRIYRRKSKESSIKL